MRTNMNNAAGYGASPTREPEFGFDGFTAQTILADMEEIRVAREQFADYAAHRLSRCAPDGGVWAADLDGKDHQTKRARLAAALDELLDDFMHQGKLEEAGEIA